MSLSDPTPVTISGSEKKLARVSTGILSSEYRSEDGNYRLKVSHTEKGERVRSLIRFDQFKIASDPVIPSQNREVTSTIYLVVDRPRSGWTNEEMVKAYEGFSTLLSGTSFSVFKKLLNVES